MAIDNKSSAGDSDTSADKKQKIPLSEAVKTVNQAIRKREEELRAYVETNSSDLVVVEGESNTGYSCCAQIYTKDVAQILLDYNEPMYRVLGEEYPDGIWNELACIAGLKAICSVDI